MIAAGVPVTVPLPVPAFVTVSAKVGRSKVAVTVVAADKVTVHELVPEQPPPLPPFVTVSAKVGTSKVAVTAVGPEIVTVQAAVPEQPPPLQPLKIDPESGVAVSVTAVPLVKFVVQFVPHAMPAGVLVTVPLPVPALVTVRADVGTSKVAVTAVAAETFTVQAAVPEQPPPLQPVKVESAVGVAVSVTTAPPA